MDQKRLFEICKKLIIETGRNKTKYCESLLSELSVSANDIEAVKLQTTFGVGAVEVYRKKMVHKVYAILRTALKQYALSKKVIAIGKSLPMVGFWPCVTLTGFRDDHIFIISRNERTKGNISKTLDPMKNPQFITFLERRL
jgi:hypothetical protein